MADKKVKSVVDAAEQRRKKGQKTRSELMEDNRALQLIILEQSETIKSLKESRGALVRKSEELTGNLETQKQYSYELIMENNYLESHPWKNLWRYMKELVGLGK